MIHTVRETAELVYEALDADDVPRFVALCADDTSVHYPAAGRLPYGGTWHGPEGVTAFLDAHDAAEEILRFEVDQMVVDGETVIAIGRFGGRAKPAGAEWSTPFVHLLTIRDGRLRRWEAFFDTAAAVEAHGAPL